MPDDEDFTNHWWLIKQRFSKGLSTGERRSSVRSAHGERGIWQRWFWEHAIRDDTDYAAQVDYCHINPVKHGFVQRAVDWPYSTFHRSVEQGIYPLDWACGPDLDIQGGERG
jgi:putative transposase